MTPMRAAPKDDYNQLGRPSKQFIRGREGVAIGHPPNQVVLSFVGEAYRSFVIKIVILLALSGFDRIGIHSSCSETH